MDDVIFRVSEGTSSESEESPLVLDVYERLLADINPTRDGDSSVLLIKVKNAYREVQQVRNYPEDASSEFIASDMWKFWNVIYNLAMYDFNIRGAEWQSTINENGEYRTFVDRWKVLSDVTPFAEVV